jgi:dTDP-4-amino-4,6-dideoxygalactose transaminase
VPLIEDNAQGFGGEYKGRPLGTIGDIGCYSFNQEKPLAVGEGGAVVTRSAELWRKMYAVRTDGSLPPSARFSTGSPNSRAANYCASEWTAALLEHQLRFFGQQFATKTETLAKLSTALARNPQIALLRSAYGTTRQPCYEIGLRFAATLAEGTDALGRLARRLSKATSINIHLTDAPVCSLPGFAQVIPPRARRLYSELLVFHHRYLLDPRLTPVLIDALERLPEHRQW